jgi:hypothetical protein
MLAAPLFPKINYLRHSHASGNLTNLHRVFLFLRLLLLCINKLIPGKHTVIGLRWASILIQARRAKTTIVKALDFLKFIQGQIYLIAPAFAGFTAMKLLPALWAYR